MTHGHKQQERFLRSPGRDFERQVRLEFMGWDLSWNNNPYTFNPFHYIIPLLLRLMSVAPFLIISMSTYRLPLSARVLCQHGLSMNSFVRFLLSEQLVCIIHVKCNSTRTKGWGTGCTVHSGGGVVGGCLSFVGSGLGELTDGRTDDDGRVTFNGSWNYIHATSATDSAKGGHSQRITEWVTLQVNIHLLFSSSSSSLLTLQVKYTHGGITNLWETFKLNEEIKMNYG